MSLKVPSNLNSIVNCTCSINAPREKSHFGNPGLLLPERHHFPHDRDPCCTTGYRSQSSFQALHISDFYHQLPAKYIWGKENPVGTAPFELILSYYWQSVQSSHNRRAAVAQGLKITYQQSHSLSLSNIRELKSCFCAKLAQI